MTRRPASAGPYASPRTSSGGAPADDHDRQPAPWPRRRTTTIGPAPLSARLGGLSITADLSGSLQCASRVRQTRAGEGEHRSLWLRARCSPLSLRSAFEGCLSVLSDCAIMVFGVSPERRPAPRPVASTTGRGALGNGGVYDGSGRRQSVGPPGRSQPGPGDETEEQSGAPVESSGAKPISSIYSARGIDRPMPTRELCRHGGEGRADSLTAVGSSPSSPARRSA